MSEGIVKTKFAATFDCNTRSIVCGREPGTQHHSLNGNHPDQPAAEKSSVPGGFLPCFIILDLDCKSGQSHVLLIEVAKLRQPI